MISKSEIEHSKNNLSTYISNHSVSFLCFSLVALHIIQFSDAVYDDIHAANPNESAVATAIGRTVVVLVDVCVNDARQLDKHVVEDRTNGPSGHYVLELREAQLT